MPYAPKVYRPPNARTYTQRRRDHDAQRYKAKPWRGWYSLSVWLRKRDHQLAIEPFCARHLKQGQTVAATVANHIAPHRGDWDKFINGALESLCKHCHDADAQREEYGLAHGGHGA